MTMTTEFSANMDRLMLGQIELEAAERAERRAHRTKVLCTIGIVLVVGLTVATLAGIGLLHLMPVPEIPQ